MEGVHHVDDNDRILMVGKISAINEQEGTARVLLEDKDEMTTKEIPLLFLHTLGMKVYAMPEIGEEVLCLFLSNGLEEGFILGSYYNEPTPPPVKDKQIKIIQFPNGDFVKYQDGKMEVKASKEVILTSASVKIQADHMQVQGEMIVSGSVKAPTFVGNLNGLARGLGS